MIPGGFGGRDNPPRRVKPSSPGPPAYVRYPAGELYALFSLESHRHRTLLVGEDLGTVPPESMAELGVLRLFVLRYALRPDAETAPPWKGDLELSFRSWRCQG
jgi:4-alpha-glucanotransferase